LVDWTLEYEDSERPYGAMYMPRDVIDGMIRRMREDNDYYSHVCNTSAYYRDLWDLWRDRTKNSAEKMMDSLILDTRNFIKDWMNGLGYMSTKYYDQPWLIPGRFLDRADQLIGMDGLDEEEKVQMKAVIAFWGNFLYDYDVYPIFTHMGAPISGVNLGTPNMPVQWAGMQSLYTFSLSSHPVIGRYLDAFTPKLALINDNGSSNACPHYAGTIGPEMNTIMLREMLGYNDWATMPKLENFARWYMDFTRPPDIRFGTRLRGYVTEGDGQQYGTMGLLGEMGTACSKTHPDLSAELLWIWETNGSHYSDFYGTNVLRINASLPKKPPKLGNAAYPGYGAVLRHGFETDKETSVHIFGGSDYYDHRHASSNNIEVWALGAPLSLTWENIYTPSFPKAYALGMVSPANVIDRQLGSWNADWTPETSSNPGWQRNREYQNDFNDFANSGAVSLHTEQGDTTWDRDVFSIHPNEDFPLVFINDRINAGANNPMIYTLPMMATGDVMTPVGAVTPRYTFSTSDNLTYPAGGDVYPMKAGFNKFEFTGQQFGPENDPAIAIDWDFYDISTTGREFSIGGWSHNTCTSTGTGIFQNYNKRPFEQTQSILRIKGSGNFKTLLVPRRKGTQAPAVQMDGETIVISTINGDTTRINNTNYSYYSYISASKDVLTAFGANDASDYGMTITGGSAEIVRDKITNFAAIKLCDGIASCLVGLSGGELRNIKDVATWNEAKGEWQIVDAANDSITLEIVTGAKDSENQRK
ncbi:MAG: hypothetical protein FWH27_19295, partial [Planctomycetaceae bacterium]|nr:hypothetical protein [Planctomycetaceae bacterium]